MDEEASAGCVLDNLAPWMEQAWNAMAALTLRSISQSALEPLLTTMRTAFYGGILDSMAALAAGLSDDPEQMTPEDEILVVSAEADLRAFNLEVDRTRQRMETALEALLAHGR